MKKYIRSERANLMEPNVYITMVIRLSGAMTKEEVRTAVEEAYKANEATMSKIVLLDNGDAFYERMEVSGCKFCEDNRNWQTIIKESEKKPFALKEGELVRTYMTKEAEQTVLLICAHHLVGDGKSVLILIEDIVSSLSGKSLTYKPMLSIDREFLKSRARLLRSVRQLTKRANRNWEKVGRSFSWEDYERVHKKYWEKHSSQVEIKRYDLKEIKSQCGNNVTLNSYLVAKLLREYPKCEVIGIPVSIRETDGGMSNQTSGIALKYCYNRCLALEENARRIHKKIYKKIRNKNMKYFILLYMELLCPSLIDAVLLQTHDCYQNKLSAKMAEIMGYVGNGGRDLGVTNLNRIDIQSEYERFKVEDIIFIPPKVSYTKNVIGISTYGEKMTVCYHNMCEK